MTVLRVKHTFFDVYKTFYKIIIRMRKTVISSTHSQPTRYCRLIVCLETVEKTLDIGFGLNGLVFF